MGWRPLNGIQVLRMAVRRRSKSRGQVLTYGIGCTHALSVTYSAAAAALAACSYALLALSLTLAVVDLGSGEPIE